MNYNSAGWKFFNANPSSALQAGTWYHIIYTRTGGIEKFYLNGIEIKSQAVGAAMQANNNNLRIGGASESGDAIEMFSGSIDDVMIYSRALSSSEVQAVYAGQN